MTVGRQEILAWMESLRAIYSEKRQLLTDLDSAIGDADHGINMDRGFSAVMLEIASNAPPDIRSILNTAATVLIRTVGGASGPLYGTFFLRAAAVCAGKPELSSPDVVALFQSGVEGVRQRGKAEPGDKTMVDALVPALAAMQEKLQQGASLEEILEAGAAAAESGMLGTIPLEARRGRASYLGPRSVGHQDPGATSSWLLIRAAAGAWRERTA